VSIETLAAVEKAIEAHIKDAKPEHALMSWVMFYEIFAHRPEGDGMMYRTSYAVSVGASPSASVGVATLGSEYMMNDLLGGEE